MTTQSRPRVNWGVRVLAAVLSSKLFFLASCTGGMVLVSEVEDRMAVNRRYMADGHRPEPLMQVVAMVPDGTGGAMKPTAVSLMSLAEFRKENPKYSLVPEPPSGRIEMNIPGDSVSYESTRLPGGAAKVVTSYFHDAPPMGHTVNAAYEASGDVVKPIYTETRRGFSPNVILGGLGLAVALAVIGACINWRLERREKAARQPG